MFCYVKNCLDWLRERQLNILCKPDFRDRELISRIRKKKLTYLSKKRLCCVAKTCRTIEETSLPGAFVEAGCALGGSSILIASLKRNKRSLYVYDVFGMIPPPSKEDTQEEHDRYQRIVEGKSNGIGGDKYYGYECNLLNIVKKNFIDFGINFEKQSVFLIKGLVQDTMEINQPVAFAHIDVDWYEGSVPSSGVNSFRSSPALLSVRLPRRLTIPCYPPA